ncbi:MAG: hypothetical protein Q4A96_02550 [Candidatus Saccharibacteria bacterium]|nr:hypothetical protein [Candidatus Saccharibacteria bacterium]
MAITKKQQAEFDIKLTESLINVIATLEEYIDSCAVNAAECGLSRRTGKVVYANRRFVKVYQADMLNCDTDRIWPIRIMQVKTAFSSYAKLESLYFGQVVHDVNGALAELAELWRASDGKGFADEIEDAFGATFISEEINKEDGSKTIIDNGFDPSDIEGDVTLLHDILLSTINEHLVEISGGHEGILNRVKSDLETIED